MLPLGIMMVLMGILGMKGAHAQCLDSVPWGTPLSFENSCCWTVAPGSDWIRYADFDQIVSDGNSSADHRILSPWVQIPASAQQDSLALMYLTGSTCREDYSVCVTTDGVHFDTLFRGRTPDEAFYYDDTLYIGAYAGQWVRFELCHYVLNSIYEPDSACWNSFTTRQLLFQNIRLESPMPPVAWMSVPEKAYVGENTLFSASLFSGSHTGLTYTWHSSLMGQTLTGDSVTMIYTAAGMDTVTMVASNAYGSDTLVSTIQVFDCSEVIVANPWMVNFETDYDCWRTVGDYGWSKYYNNSNPGIMASSSGGNSMIASPAVALPADSTGLRLYWKDRRMSSSVTYYVMVSRDGRFDLDDYDTLYTSTSQNYSLTQRSASLADYAGDTVYIAFRQKYQIESSAFVFDVKMYNALAPLGTLEAPTYAVATGDTVRYTLHLTQGDSVSYSWHSALLDTSITTIGSMVSIVYPFPGSETLTVTVSNSHGALSLETSLGVFDCDTIRTFPWIEDFVETGSDAGYSACWNISGYSHLADHQSYSYSEEDGSPSTGSSRHDFMKSSTYGGFMFTPLIAVPAVIEKNLSLWVEHFYSLKVVIETESGTFDTVYSLNTRETIMRRRPISLEPYAGQTIRVRLMNNTYSNIPMSMVDRIRIDYDTMPVIVLSGQKKTTTDSATLFVATQLRGFVPGLTYTWHSQVGGTFVTNATGDSAWVTYSAGITRSEDTVSVVATNAYGSGSAQRAIYVRDCSPQTSLPWRETFADGTVCWYKPEGSKFYDAIPYNSTAYERLRHLYLNTHKDTLGSWIMSKAIEIPADTDMGATLFWKVASSHNSYHHLYSVLATTADDYTDTANYTVLYTDSSTHINFSNYDTRSVSLAQYAGQTIHVAIHNHGNHLASDAVGLYFDDIEVRSTQAPVVSVTADASTYYNGDTARFTATLLEGSTNGITYTWHSTMLDSTVTINSNLFTLNYTQSGVDTVSVIATNAYGSDTASVIVNSTIITQPQVALQHTEANVGEPTVFTAVLNRCVTEGLTYTWHSTLLDTTITLNYNLLSINYPSTGVDTVTVIATNIYGSDTAVAVVSVQDCTPRMLPYIEDFNGVIATDAATAGNLPDCWNYFWNGSNAAYAPHVITTGGYQYMNDIPDNALLFMAGNHTGYGSTAVALMPRFADSLQHLALALDYRFESSYGTLTVGWYDSNEVFHTVKNLTGHQGSYLHDTVLFTDQEAANYRIALWWEFGSSWYGAAVDNIEVFVDNTIHAPANLAVDNIGAHSARVTWAAVDSASAYHVQINGVLDTTVSGLACNLTGLSPHTQYTVHVAAIVGTETGRFASTTFTTLCGAVSLPYSNDFSQGESSVECWTSSNLNQFHQSGYMIIWSGLSSKPSYQTTPIVANPGNQMVVSFRARKYGTSTTESGRLIVGAMTNPADTTTFTAIDTFMTTSAWSEYRFSTRNLDTTPVAIAFCVGTGDGEFCNVAIDDLSIEVPIACASLASAEAVSMGPTSALISWQYDPFGAQSADGVLVDLYDSTANNTTHFVAHGTDTILTGLPLRHVFRAELRALCGTDTAEAVSVTFTPEASACAEIAVDYDYSAYMWCNPIMGDKNYGYSQTLYPAAFAASVDTLYGIALRMAGNYSETRTLDVYIGQTTADTLISPVSVASHTLAAQNYTFSPSTGWAKILFDTPVPIDGVSNLIVTIDDNTGDWGNSMSTCAHYATPGVMLYYDEHFYDTENVDPVALGFDVSRTNKIPDLQLLGHCATDRCLQPVIIVEPDSNMLLVSWQQRGSESLWHVEYRREGSSNWLLADSTAETSYSIQNLNASTPYEVRVGSVCGDSVIYSNSVRCYTPCGAVNLPYYHDFTIDNTCWYTHNNYSSSSVGLDLHAGSWPVASPAVNGDISQTAVRFKISGNPNWNPVLKIGVGGANGENAVWLDSMMLSHGDVQEYTVYLTGYSGNEHHVLFQSDDPYARMREVTFEAVGCQAVHHVNISQLSDTSVLLIWPPVSDEGGEWAVYANDSLVAVTTTPSYLLGGLESGTDYTAAVREICWTGDTAEAATVSFTTLCPTQSLPWVEDFESYSSSPSYSTDVVIPCWHTILPAINVASYVSLVSIGSLHSSRALKFYDHIYVTQHTPNVFIYAASSLVNTEGRAATVQFDLNVTRVPQSPDQPFIFQAGIMTDVSDSTTFIPMVTVDTTGDMHCSFSTDSLQLPDLFSVAFRFCGDISAFVDNLSVTAVPLPTHDLTLSVNDTIMGSVAGAGTYEEGSNITVSAIPNEGYHFVMWNDSVTIATRTVKVETDTAFTAFFAPDSTPVIPDTVWYTVSVTTDAPEACEVYGSGVYADSSTVEIGFLLADTAIEGGHWQFLGWSDGGSGNPRDILVTSDTAIVALFEWIEDSVGIDNVSTTQHINVYPNPASTDVTVSVSQPSVLTVIDLQGRMVIPPTSINSQFLILHSQLAPGTYFLRIATEEGVTVKKLIMQ